MMRVTDLGYWMHPTLKANLDSMIHNTKKDWSHIIIVSGSGKTRIGKTMLAQQICYYLSYHLGRTFDMARCVFAGDDLIKQGLELPPSVFLYDEARAELNAKKAMSHASIKLIDFFAETGMLNHIVVLVLTDFFELNKNLAVGQSECLINVFVSKKVGRDRELGVDVLTKERGYFGYWGDSKKRLLYIKGKKEFDSYEAQKWDFWGNYGKFWVLPENEYDAKKVAFIRREREVMTGGYNAQRVQRDILIAELLENHGFTQQGIADLFNARGLSMTQQAIAAIFSHYKKQKTEILTPKGGEPE